MHKPPFNPFHVYTSALETLLLKAAKTKSPALYLYMHEARTPLFMLEALTRLYTHHLGGSQMNVWRKHFKKLEDQLGVVDYYDGFLKVFSKNKKIPQEVIVYIEKKKKKSLQKLDTILAQKKWLNGLLTGFHVSSAYIDYDEGHMALLRYAIHLQEEIVRKLAAKSRQGFTELEEQVHELRRQCRWLSMYAQALDGLIQLRGPSKPYVWEKHYITKAIIKHPYNRVAKAPRDIEPLYYNASVVYALSDLIARLGVIKDKGLGLELLTKALRKTKGVSSKVAINEALTMLGKNYPTMPQVLKEATDVSRVFFINHKVLKDGILITKPTSR